MKRKSSSCTVMQCLFSDQLIMVCVCVCVCQIIKQCQVILNFLAAEGRLSTQHVDCIWAAAQVRRRRLTPGLTQLYFARLFQQGGAARF